VLKKVAKFCFKVLSRRLRVGARPNHEETLAAMTGLRFKPRRPEYEAGVPTAEPLRLVASLATRMYGTGVCQ
jgi:hypothetical protein